MQASVRPDGVITQFGTSIGEREGEQIVELNEEQAAALRAAVTTNPESVKLVGGVVTATPRPAPPPPAPDVELGDIRAVLSKADTDITAAERAALILRVLRRLDRRGLL